MNKKIVKMIRGMAVAFAFLGTVLLWGPVTPIAAASADNCTHEDYEWVTLVKPTCSKPGKKVMICQDCEEMLETELIEKTEHKCKWEKTQEATCAYPGVKSYICKNCGAVTETEEIPVKNHSFVWTTTRDATCAENGIKQQLCKNCDAIGETKYTDTKKHKYGSWTVKSIVLKGKTVTVSETRTCTSCKKNSQSVTGTTKPFNGKHGKKKYFYKCTKKSGKIVILCSECHQSVTGKISGGTVVFTKSRKDNSRTTSKTWKALK